LLDCPITGAATTYTGFQDAGGTFGNLPSFCTEMVGTIANQLASNAGGSMFEANVIPMMTILQFLFFALSTLSWVPRPSVRSPTLPINGFPVFSWQTDHLA
jgi:hypothetical protein